MSSEISWEAWLVVVDVDGTESLGRMFRNRDLAIEQAKAITDRLSCGRAFIEKVKVTGPPVRRALTMSDVSYTITRPATCGEQ